MLVTMANTRDCKLVGKACKALMILRLEDKEIKPIYFFSVLYVCGDGDRSSVPVTLRKNMPGEVSSSMTLCQNSLGNSW